MVLHLKWLGKHRGDTLRERLRVVRMVAGHLQTQKFVAALTRQEFACNEQPPHPVGHLDQEAIAGAVPERVVDVFESVDVDRERRQLVGLLVRLGGVEGEALVEGDAVRQAGHGVVEGELIDAIGRFRARTQVDDVGREAGPHHQQHRADHGKTEHMRRDQIGRQHDRRVGNRRGRGRQRVVHDADHEGQHDRRAVAAPARHRAVGPVDRERRERQPEQEGDGDAIDVPFDGACDVPALEGEEMHGENADAHHEAAGLGCQRKMTAADLEPGQAGDDGDGQHGGGRFRLKAAVQGRIEREDRNEGRGP